MRVMRLLPLLGLAVAVAVAGARPALAQFGPGGPPAVGVVRVQREPVIDSNEFVGRVQAIDRVDLVARVTAFLEEREFTEGAEVAKGALLYRLERGPFEADVAAKAAAVAQAQALLRNTSLTLSRANSLLHTPAGQQSTVDTALANQGSQAAQVAAAQAQLKASQINLDYTEIRAPVAGRITRTAVTIGNVVSPSSGTLATIVSQDPMYVLFPIAVRTALQLRDKYAPQGGLSAVKVRLRLSDGRVYGPTGYIDYVDPTVSTTTDTLTIRARIPNPTIAGMHAGDAGDRELVDGEFVTVIVESIKPTPALVVPRVAVLADQQGSYVYLVGPGNKVAQARVTLGQATDQAVVITSGLAEGDEVIAEGIQRARPGIVVNPSPVGAPPPGFGPGGAPAVKPAGG
jgi:membrane fusion protein (multidrug efflux system)